MKKATGKSRKRTQAIGALLKHRTIAEAAAACGVTARTVLNWLNEPEFKQEYEQAKADLLESTINALRKGGFDSVNVLRTIAENGEAPAAARVSAARAMLELLLRGVALEEIEARIRQLEQNLKGENDV